METPGFGLLLPPMSSRLTERLYLDMTIVSKLNLFRIELHYLTPYPQPPNRFLLLLLIYITLYSFSHSGSLGVLLTSSTQLQSPVDSNCLPPAAFPLLLPQLLCGCPKGKPAAVPALLYWSATSLVSAPSILSPTCRLDRSIGNANQIPVLLFQIPQCLLIACRTLLKFLYGVNKAL